MGIKDRYSRESLKSRAFKLLLKLSGSKRFWEKSGADLIKAIEKRRMLNADPPQKLHQKARIIKGEIDGNYYYKLEPYYENDNKPIFYVHGGAYVYRISRLHWNFLGRLVNALNCTIIVPLYPLAPEHTYKEALRFIYALYMQQIDMINNPADMILMGDSAGGGLALVLAQLLKEKQLEQPGKIILISPWLDLSLTNPEIAPLEKYDPFLVRTGLIEAGKMYAGLADTKHPKVSPMYGDLNGLGEITLFMGTHDILVADARRFVTTAKQQNINIHYIEADKMVHIYPIYNFPESKVALQQMVDKIER